MLEKTLTWVTSLFALITILFLFLWRAEVSKQKNPQFQGRSASEIYGYASIDQGSLEVSLAGLYVKWASQQEKIDQLYQKRTDLQRSLENKKKKKKELDDETQLLEKQIEIVKKLVETVSNSSRGSKEQK